MIFVANIDMKSQNIVAGEEVEVGYVEDFEYECTGYPYLIADPVIDGLVYFRYPDAPWTAVAEETANKIASVWEYICQMDDFKRPIPGEVMVGTHFKVLCWRDYGACRAGKIYDAKITNHYHGLGTDGFLVSFDENDPDHREADDTYVVSRYVIYVDTVKDAINHFVLA